MPRLSSITLLTILFTTILIIRGPFLLAEIEVNQVINIGPIKVVDMTHSIQNNIPIFFNIFHGVETVATVEEYGYYMNSLSMTEHTSTHMDAPAHFVEGRWTIDQIPLERLYGVTVVMDARPYITHPNDTITAEEIMDWEAKTGIEIPRNGILFVYTGWSDYWGLYDSWEEYMEVTGGGFPGFSVDAADYLISKNIIGVGIDTLSIDPAPSTTFDFHVRLLDTNAWAIENLYVPPELLNKVVFTILAPMKIKTGSGAPTRIWAFYDPTANSIETQFLLANLLKSAFDQAIKYDLSWAIQNGIPIFFNIFKGFSNLATIEEWGYYINWIEMFEHTSTHMDAPAHFVEGRWTIDQIPLSNLMGRALIMDMRWAISNPNDTVSLTEIRKWEYENSISISEGDILLIYTGWGDYWGLYDSWEEYMEVTGGGFPGFSVDAADYLISKNIIGVGIDTLSIDPAPSTTFDFHVKVLGDNIYGIENIAITSEHRLLNKTGYIIIMPLMVRGGSGGPARIYLFENLDLSSIINLYLTLKTLYERDLETENLINQLEFKITELSMAIDDLTKELGGIIEDINNLASEIAETRNIVLQLKDNIEDTINEFNRKLEDVATQISSTGIYSYTAIAIAIILPLVVLAYLTRKIRVK